MKFDYWKRRCFFMLHDVFYGWSEYIRLLFYKQLKCSISMFGNMYACICTLVKQLFLFCIMKLLRTKTNSAFSRTYILVFTKSKLLDSYHIVHIHVCTRTLPSHVLEYYIMTSLLITSDSIWPLHSSAAFLIYENGKKAELKPLITKHQGCIKINSYNKITKPIIIIVMRKTTL